METRPPVHMLWIGARLTALERLSILSFLANGHPVRLFTYGDVDGIPDGVERHDGREILPADAIFTYAEGHGKGSHAGFANLFRYKLLLDHEGYWSDTDTVCLKPFDFSGEYVVGRERMPQDPASGQRRERLANGVLRAPRNSPVMQDCFEAASRADKSKVKWGEIGPQLVTERFAHHGLLAHSLPPPVFYPNDWWNMDELVTKPLAVGPESYAIHLWNSLWLHKGYDKDARYPRFCAYEALKRRYGVSRA